MDIVLPIYDRMIAIIDDNFDNRRAVSRWLQICGFETIELNSACEFFESLKNHLRPDLILLDLVMPVMGGLECLRLLREDVHWRAIPVLMLSGVSDTTSIDEALRLGAKDYVIKGTAWNILVSKIHLHMPAAA